jgi:putative membrane protein
MKKALCAACALLGLLALPAAAATKPSAMDEQWLKTSIAGDRFEIAGGKLAMKKGTTKAVKSLAARLVKDHSKSLSESLALAKKLHVQAPARPTPSMQWELQAVAQFSGDAFDAQYANLEILDHVQDIAEAKDEASDGSDADVTAAAKKAVPILKMHLSMARHALARSGATNSG